MSRAARTAGAKGALVWALRLGLGVMFLWAGALKLRDVSTFAVEIYNYHLFPSLAPLLAATLPTVEIALGAAMLVAPRRWARAAALASGVVLAVFTVAVASAVARGINVTCGCFGEGSGPVTLVTVLRDVALVAAAAALYRLTGEPGAPASPPTAPASPSEAPAH